MLRVSINGQEPQGELLLRGEAKVLDQIETRVEDSILVLGPKSGANFSTNEILEVSFSHPGIESIAAGAGARVCLDDLRGEFLALQAESGSQVEVNGTVRTVTARAESGALVDLSGLSARSVSSQSASGGRIRS